jgi:hypothetical protein
MANVLWWGADGVLEDIAWWLERGWSMSQHEPVRGSSKVDASRDWGLWVVTSLIALAFLFT